MSVDYLEYKYNFAIKLFHLIKWLKRHVENFGYHVS